MQIFDVAFSRRMWREDETSPPGCVRGFSREAPRHLPHEFFAGGDDSRKGSAVARREAKTLRFHRDNVGAGRWPSRPERDSFCNGGHQQRPARVRQVRDMPRIFKDAEKIRRLDDDSGRFVVQGRFQTGCVDLPSCPKSDFEDMQSHVARVRLQHLAILGMQRPGQDHAATSGEPLRHQHSFSGGGRAVPHRGVRNLHARELAHQRLKFKNGLQRALADLGLIGRVRSQEFAALDQGISDNRAQMVVHARAEEAGIPARIFRGPRAEVINDLLLGKRSWEAQRRVEPERCWNRGEQIVQGPDADPGEHFLALCWTFRKVAHQAAVPFSETKAWYEAASIRLEASAGLANLTLMSHPAPWGSELTVSGAFASAEFTSVTSPNTGA